MSLVLVVPVAEAALFTAGCAAIHALRRHADGVTLALAGLTVLLVLLVGISCTPEDVLDGPDGGLTQETGTVRPAID